MQPWCRLKSSWYRWCRLRPWAGKPGGESERPGGRLRAQTDRICCLFFVQNMSEGTRVLIVASARPPPPTIMTPTADDACASATKSIRFHRYLPEAALIDFSMRMHSFISLAFGECAQSDLSPSRKFHAPSAPFAAVAHLDDALRILSSCAKPFLPLDSHPPIT